MRIKAFTAAIISIAAGFSGEAYSQAQPDGWKSGQSPEWGTFVYTTSQQTTINDTQQSLIFGYGCAQQPESSIHFFHYFIIAKGAGSKCSLAGDEDDRAPIKISTPKSYDHDYTFKCKYEATRDALVYTLVGSYKNAIQDIFSLQEQFKAKNIKSFDVTLVDLRVRATFSARNDQLVRNMVCQE
ncbi:hypothetical protein V5G24_23065 [Xanthobacter sp. VTT E-85241]|uniref:hypothetical protein n=1 Tax=Roseixanthobacter finlandensis TaxID=3119922 RepID=UPI00372A8529